MSFFSRNRKETRKTYQVYLFCVFVVSRLQTCTIGLRDLRFTKPAYILKNDHHFDAQSAQNPHIPARFRASSAEVRGMFSNLNEVI